MHTAAIAITYGIVASTIVASALAMIVWGIVNERRDRVRYEQGRMVFGDCGAALERALSRKGDEVRWPSVISPVPGTSRRR
jgi:hypothetical protein